ncbi:15132_t:CDS:2 [Cetraspora pellucida]|uniref:15132_t:CDS:1 n=1 Tax=Cetraspora pellucida TaxID=1433469 RepID=A0A9N9FCE9_9GLOM|nr:15132_t:CDS:2 [Cetraspora pellucida]
MLLKNEQKELEELIALLELFAQMTELIKGSYYLILNVCYQIEDSIPTH